MHVTTAQEAVLLWLDDTDVLEDDIEPETYIPLSEKMYILRPTD
jgi:hypothetical protein